MITNRPNQRVAHSEREAFLKFTGLTERELEWVRLEQELLPELNFDSLDGIIMGGSSDDVSAAPADKSPTTKRNEAALRGLLRKVLEADFPFLGICYGLGLLVDELGGRVGYDIHEDIQAPPLELTEAGAADPLLAGFPREFRAYVGHHESVLALPDSTTCLVSGQVAPYQMVKVGENAYATQFHPELDLAGILLRIDVFADFGYFPSADRAQIEARVHGVDVTSAHSLLRRFVDRYAGRRGIVGN